MCYCSGILIYQVRQYLGLETTQKCFHNFERDLLSECINEGGSENTKKIEGGGNPGSKNDTGSYAGNKWRRFI